MTIHIPRVWLITGLVLICLVTANAQTSLTLTYGNPASSPDSAFNGNVFQAGTEIGDAFFFAKFGGTGTRYFEIDSPGESITKKVIGDGYVSIRPVANITIDQSKIKAFTGPVSGSIVVTIKPLSITTVNTSVVTDVVPGSEISIYYRTGAGTFPTPLVNQKFGVQLLDASGAQIGGLLNATDQYSSREQAKASNGDIRTIKTTIPLTTASGLYRVRVVTQGLLTNVLGSASSSFTVKASAPVTPTILAGSVTGSACPGGIVSFPFSTTGTFPSGNAFKVQLINASGSVMQDLPGLSSNSPISTTLPASFTAGTYRFQIAATATSVQSNTSSLSVLATPTMTISGSSTVTVGATAPVRLTFTGTPPWSVTYIDNATTRTVTSSVNSTSITPTFLSSTLFDKSFIKAFSDGGCGLSSAISGSAQITVVQLTITTGTLSGTFCPGTTVPVSFTTSSSLPSDVIYQVQLSDGTGSFLNAQVIGSGTMSPLTGQLPATLVATSGYRVQVVIQKPTTSGSVDYSGLASPVSSPLLVNRPDAPKVTNFSICSGINTTPLSATGVNLKWYTTGTSSQSLTSAPAPSNSQSSTYYVSQTVSGCESARQPLSVSVVTTPSVPAVGSVSLCQGAQAQFSTPIPNPLWYTSETGGTGSTQPPTLNNQPAGEQTFYVSQTINGCESARATVKATVYSIPAAPTISASVPLCQFTTASPLTANGISLTWYGQSGRLPGAPTPSTLLAGTQSYSVSQTINTCESSRTTVRVVVRPASPTPTANSVRYCIGDVPRSLTANGSNLKWYTSSNGGTSSSTSPAFFTEIATTLTFYVTQTDTSGCESVRQPVSVSVVSPPSAPTVTANQLVCQSSKVGSLTASPNTGLVWQGPGIIGSSEIAPVPNTTQPGTFTYAVAQRAGSCTSQAAQILFTVSPTPAAPQVQTPVIFCVGITTTPLSATGSSLTWYTNADHSGSSLKEIRPDISRVSITTYYVTQRSANNCESPNSAIEVRVSPKATATLTGDGDIYPGDSTAIRVRLTGDAPWTFTDWTAKQISIDNPKDSLYVAWVRPNSTTTYAIKNLTSRCGPGDSGAPYVLRVNTPLSTQPALEPLLITIYPNPTSSNVSLNWSSPTKQTVTLQIINTTGTVIRQITRTSVATPQTESFKLDDQPAGLYFLQVKTPTNGVQVKPILKQ